MFIMSYSFFLMELEWNPNWINGDKKTVNIMTHGWCNQQKNIETHYKPVNVYQNRKRNQQNRWCRQLLAVIQDSSQHIYNHVYIYDYIYIWLILCVCIYI